MEAQAVGEAMAQVAVPKRGGGAQANSAVSHEPNPLRQKRLRPDPPRAKASRTWVHGSAAAGWVGGSLPTFARAKMRLGAVKWLRRDPTRAKASRTWMHGSAAAGWVGGSLPTFAKAKMRLGAVKRRVVLTMSRRAKIPVAKLNARRSQRCRTFNRSALSQVLRTKKTLAQVECLMAL